MIRTNLSQPSRGTKADEGEMITTIATKCVLEQNMKSLSPSVLLSELLLALIDIFIYSECM